MTREDIREHCGDMYWKLRSDFIGTGTCDEVRTTLDDMEGILPQASRRQHILALVVAIAATFALFAGSLPGVPGFF